MIPSRSGVNESIKRVGDRVIPYRECSQVFERKLGNTPPFCGEDIEDSVGGWGYRREENGGDF